MCSEYDACDPLSGGGGLLCCCVYLKFPTHLAALLIMYSPSIVFGTTELQYWSTMYCMRKEMTCSHLMTETIECLCGVRALLDYLVPVVGPGSMESGTMYSTPAIVRFKCIRSRLPSHSLVHRVGGSHSAFDLGFRHILLFIAWVVRIRQS
jgi:hypothetical protein